MIAFACLAYHELSRHDIHDLFAARQEVFVVEQKCCYLDVDGRDLHARHLLGRSVDGELAAYARILAPDVLYVEPSIGRVLTVFRFRGLGLGRRLMQRAIADCQQVYAGQSIRIAAQRYLVRFYRKLGFAVVGEPYDEDGIPHIQMLLSTDVD